jgi:hypothetical protein
MTPKDFELDEADPKHDAKFTTAVVPEKCIHKEQSSEESEKRSFSLLDNLNNRSL